MNDKVVLFHISYYIDNPKTWLSFMLVSKNAKIVCDYRKKQKQWQFQRISIHACERNELFMMGSGIDGWSINNNFWPDLTFEMTRLEFYRIIGKSPI